MKIASRIIAAACAASAFATTAQAQTTFTGFTNACFYTVVSCVPENTNVNATDANGLMTYRNSTFSGMTSGGFLGIGNAPGVGVNIDNLGSFSLTNGTQNFAGGFFNLRVSFSAPSGVVPPNTVFTANLSGNVTALGTDNGGFSIMFTNPSQNFVFDGGSFTLNVNSLSVQGVGANAPDRNVALTGFITATVVPEPSTYLLMAAGLAAVGMFSRRRQAVRVRAS